MRQCRCCDRDGIPPLRNTAIIGTPPSERSTSQDPKVIHYLTVGHLDWEALRECGAVAIRPLDETTVRQVLAEFPGIPRSN